jgi:hypothetical protein
MCWEGSTKQKSPLTSRQWAFEFGGNAACLQANRISESFSGSAILPYLFLTVKRFLANFGMKLFHCLKWQPKRPLTNEKCSR